MRMTFRALSARVWILAVIASLFLASAPWSSSQANTDDQDYDCGSLSSCQKELSRHLEEQRKAQRELDAIVAGKEKVEGGDCGTACSCRCGSEALEHFKMATSVTTISTVPGPNGTTTQQQHTAVYLPPAQPPTEGEASDSRMYCIEIWDKIGHRIENLSAYTACKDAVSQCSRVAQDLKEQSLRLYISEREDRIASLDRQITEKKPCDNCLATASEESRASSGPSNTQAIVGGLANIAGSVFAAGNYRAYINASVGLQNSFQSNCALTTAQTGVPQNCPSPQLSPPLAMGSSGVQMGGNGMGGVSTGYSPYLGAGASFGMGNGMGGVSTGYSPYLGAGSSQYGMPTNPFGAYATSPYASMAYNGQYSALQNQSGLSNYSQMQSIQQGQTDLALYNQQTQELAARGAFIAGGGSAYSAYNPYNPYSGSVAYNPYAASTGNAF